MKWLETIAFHFKTCCHSKSFDSIELFNKKMLIHQTVLDIQTKRYLLFYKVSIKSPQYGDKDSLDQCRYKHQYQKKKPFSGGGVQKNVGMGSNIFL